MPWRFEAHSLEATPKAPQGQPRGQGSGKSTPTEIGSGTTRQFVRGMETSPSRRPAPASANPMNRWGAGLGRPEPGSRRGKPMGQSSTKLRESPCLRCRVSRRVRVGPARVREQAGLANGRELRQLCLKCPGGVAGVREGSIPEVRTKSRLGWPMGVGFAKLPGRAQAALLPVSTAQPSDIPQWIGGLGKPMGVELANPA
jgi:hypothetical protein